MSQRDHLLRVSQSLQAMSPFAIRTQTAEIRCGWNSQDYHNRRNEARRRQEELFGVASWKVLPVVMRP